jgi:hypothetical protein
MKIGSSVLVAFMFVTGAATASTQNASAKLQRIGSPTLCYLETAAIEKDVVMVRDELARRDVACTSALAAEGQAAFQRSQSIARVQTVGNDMGSAVFYREYNDKQRHQRSVNCQLQRKGYYC